MTVFRGDGHLRLEALAALARNEDVFDELERLEAAEHLAFCGECLQRYTALLEDGAALLTPEHSCQKTLWLRIRSRALGVVVSRCATAAAAVAIALTALWGGRGVELACPVLPEDRPSVSEKLAEWPEELNDSLRQTVSGLSAFLDGLRPGQFIEGGNKA